MEVDTTVIAEFTLPKNKPGPGNKLYPWREWLDGRKHRIVLGTHFTLSIKSMRTSIHTACKARKMRAECRVDRAANAIEFVATKLES